MKITQLMLAKGFGGAERYFVDLSLALAARGHEVQVICHRRFRELDRLLGQHALRVETCSPAGWWDFIAGRRIKAAVSRFGPSVVHAHLARGASMAGKACANLGIPLIVKTHNYVNLKYYRHVDRFIATTRRQKEYLERQGIKAERISVVPNFSSLPPVDSIRLHSGQAMRFVACGRLVRKKGFHVLLESFRRYLDQGHRARLIIGGDGPEAASLRSQCRALKLDTAVSFSGWVSDIAVFMQDADVFILPSLDEPFGIAVLEAMALGLPIIATSTDGPREILDQQTAYLVPPGDVASLAMAMIEAGNTEQRKEKATNALDLFRKRYSRDVVVDALLEVYGEVLNDQGIR